jgi:THO complex subunit 7
MSSGLNEDEIIKKRLLIEGDSGNEDRCINKLIKIFIKWSNSTANDDRLPTSGQAEDDMTGASAHDMMIALLSHIKFGLTRNELILGMNKLEQDNYEHLYKKIESEISNARHDIVKYKAELQQARKVRKNRQEYDVLAKEILKYANRQELETSIERLNKQLDDLKEMKTSLSHKIDVRRKQFSVVLSSLHTLKGLIDNEQYEESGDAIQAGEAVDLDAGKLVDGDVNRMAMSDNDDEQDDAQSDGDNSDRQHHSSKRIKIDTDDN